MRSLLTLMACAMLAISVGCDSAATPEKKEDAKTTESAATTPATGETQTVSLKLPNMT
ncbi:MAG: hypothetical protein AB8B55_13955 [Mariniblastus sp.]